jgi:hypothetical protein
MSAALASYQPANPERNPANAFEFLCSLAAAAINAHAINAHATNASTPQASAIDSVPRAGCPPSAPVGLDWSAFLQLAEHHGVLALIAADILVRPELPLTIEQSVRAFHAANAKRSLWLASELGAILDHFAKKDIRAIPYKGPVLAQSAYGNLALRTFHDLDLLIPATQFAAAKNALAGIGFHPSQALALAVERLYLRTGYERSFDGAAGKNMVELQWQLLPRLYAVDASRAGMSFNDLDARAGRITLGTASVPCLSPEDSFLTLCLHGAKHLWSRLIWVADIAATLRSQPIDFAAVSRRARAMGIARIAAVSLRLAEQLLSAPLPEAARGLITRHPEELRLANEFSSRLARSTAYDFDSADYFLEIRRLRERPTDRWAYLWRLLWTPGPGEVAAVKLPEPLFPLYRVVRLGRLLRKLV